MQAQELLAHVALDRAIEQEMAQYQLEVIRVANARREDAEEERRQQGQFDAAGLSVRY